VPNLRTLGNCGPKGGCESRVAYPSRLTSTHSSSSGVFSFMAKTPTRHKHTYRNGTKLTLSATKRGLRVYWKEELDGKRHPSYTIPWNKVDKIRAAQESGA